MKSTARLRITACLILTCVAQSSSALDTHNDTTNNSARATPNGEMHNPMNPADPTVDVNSSSHVTPSSDVTPSGLDESWSSSRPRVQSTATAPSGVYEMNLTACNMSQSFTHLPVEDGLTVEAYGAMSTGFFLCHMLLETSEGRYVAAVVQDFTLERAPAELTDDMDVYLTLEGGWDMQRSGTYLGSWNHRDYKNDFLHDFVVPSNANNMLVTVQSAPGARSILLKLRVLVTELPGTTLLPQVYVPPHGGYITSFAFDGHTRYAYDTQTQLDLDMADGEGVIISFPHFDLEYDWGCRADVFELYTNVSGYMKKWAKCGGVDILPSVYDTNIRIRFHGGQSQARTGFKMLYSIHPLSQLPQLTAGVTGTAGGRSSESDLFNCSVPHYPTFQLHFHCNLETECVAGEDEAHCPYTSMDCGAGNIDAGNKCYRYLTVRGVITWYDANEQCKSRGHRLVSPRTLSEWGAFRTVIAYGKKTFGVFVGLSTSPSTLHSMYRDVWRWNDQTMAFYVNARGNQVSKLACAYVPPIYADVLQPIICGTPLYVIYVLCEHDKPHAVNGSPSHVTSIDVMKTSWVHNITVTSCLAGHVTHDFLSCDLDADCGLTTYVTSCPLIDVDDVPLFVCDAGSQTLHYTLVCDHRHDCGDGSDETWCVHDACLESQVPCNSKQCVRRDQLCDGMWHCQDGADEDCPQFVPAVAPSIPPPAIVSLDGYGGYTIRALDPAQPCPVTHFQCSKHDYCLPVYLRCNGVYDCPGHEDEAGCDSYTCPGMYRCRASRMCVHSEHVCDGVFQCPQQDDELLCVAACPHGCRCQGLAFICNQMFAALSFPGIRYLDASGSGMTPRDLGENHYLVRLSLSQCGLTTVANWTFPNPNLRWLDLSANALTSVSMQTFVGLRNLRTLRLAANPMTSLIPITSDGQHINLHTLDLSETMLVTYDGRTLAVFQRLVTLNISHGAFTTITAEGLSSTPSVRVLDLRESPLEDFPRYLLRQLAAIDAVYASNFKLCCPAVLPDGFNPNNCHAPVDEIVSCDDLLRSNAYRGFLWLMAAMTIAGNAGSMTVRFLQSEVSKSGFHVFVTNLCLADLLMGVYLIIIGCADVLYRDRYLWNDTLWRRSVACKVAGFLSMLSSEVSAFFICLITLDRLFALRFPLSDIRFHKRSALAACAVAWTSGFLLALVPLTSKWELYSQTGICIPLPITRATLESGYYSFGVMIVLNFILFMLIALGQAFIFLSVRMNAIMENRGKQDLIIARRLTSIVLSDFMCWFPIGLLGLLAATGTPISSELNVGIAIFVLPFNSALNPFLYTINVVLEKRRKAAEARLLHQLQTKHTVAAQSSTVTRTKTVRSSSSVETQTDVTLMSVMPSKPDVVEIKI